VKAGAQRIAAELGLLLIAPDTSRFSQAGQIPHDREWALMLELAESRRIVPGWPAVSTKNHSTRPRPRCRVLRKPPTVFIHPKGSSMRLRLIVLMR
jgi:hypothetical protein